VDVKLNPFQTLVSIAQRSQSVARELPSKEDTQAHWMGLGFWLHETRFVVPLEEVVELMHVPRTTHLPGVKKWITGVANVRGRLMTLVDLAVFFGHSSKRSRSQRRIFVVEGEDAYFGFIVDESLGMQHFTRDSRSDEVEGVDDGHRVFVDGSYHAAGLQWPVMSLAKITQKIRSESIAI
jgi:twitching motility protein PilI